MANNFPTIRPSLNMNFAGTGVLPPDVTFTRASSSGGYYDGVTVSKAEENLLLNSATLVTQNVTTRAEAYTLSFTGTGTVTLSGTSTAGPLVGTGVADRVTLTFTPTAGTLTLTATGSVTLAQLEARSSVTAYTPTTTQPITNYIPKLLFAPANVPVFDHNPTTGEALGLSVWEARTNLLLRSQEFDDAYWTKTRSSISADQIIAPDGTLTADKLVEDTSTNTHVLQRSISLGGSVDSSAYTISFYVKASERSFLQAYDNGQSASGATVFDLSTGAVTSGTGTITSVGNGWYKCAIYPLKDSSTTAILVFVLQSDAGTSSYLGDGTSGIYIWGAQLEAGALATPYIPTVASTVARSADVAVMTGANFSRWYRQDEGTFVVEAEGYINGQSMVVAQNTSLSNYIDIAWRSAGVTAPFVNFVKDSVTQASLTDLSAGDNVVAVSYAFNDFKGSINGRTAITDTSGSVPVVDQLKIYAPCAIKSIAYYPKALTTAQLEAVTA
jgi:hypothetical protein